MILMNRTRVPVVPLEVNFLLSALIKAEPRENFELKKLYENEKKQNNKPQAEHHTCRDTCYVH